MSLMKAETDNSTQNSESPAKQATEAHVIQF